VPTTTAWASCVLADLAQLAREQQLALPRVQHQLLAQAQLRHRHAALHQAPGNLLGEDPAQARGLLQPVHVDQRRHQHAAPRIERRRLQQPVHRLVIGLEHVGAHRRPAPLAVVIACTARHAEG
jgi:hypothetical protein